MLEARFEPVNPIPWLDWFGHWIVNSDDLWTNEDTLPYIAPKTKFLAWLDPETIPYKWDGWSISTPVILDAANRSWANDVPGESMPENADE